jgi:hypothetical protein
MHIQRTASPAVRLSSTNSTINPCNGLRLVGLSECNVFDIPVMIAPLFSDHGPVLRSKTLMLG